MPKQPPLPILGIAAQPSRRSGVSKRALSAIRMLEAAGYEAYFCGGCVRDYIMGYEPNDWDIATNAAPTVTLEVFKEYATKTNGLKHGTVRVLLKDEELEITTFRTESDYADSRHPNSVAFVGSLTEDVQRRDFTMNALAMKVHNVLQGGGCRRQYEVIDLAGGVADIEAGIIRCVGDPEKRFTEDALRILRAVRFASKLGFRIEEATAQAALKLAPNLQYISAERKRDELNKLLCGEYAPQVLREYRELLAAVIPELAWQFDRDQLNPYHKYTLWEHTVRTIEALPCSGLNRWAALLHDVGKKDTFTTDAAGIGHFYGHAGVGAELTDRILQDLRFSNYSRTTITTLVKHHMDTFEPTRKAVRRAVFKYGHDTFRRLISLQRADRIACEPDAPPDDLFDRLEALRRELEASESVFTRADLAVNGNDLVQLGYRKKQIREELEKLVNAVLDETLPNERAKLLATAEDDIQALLDKK
ncbi:MAG: HD domain-containing protein [Oscillospiraceae bacterium]|nr:HD domain-containing protein [Oscillospiraceae bacterium]